MLARKHRNADPSCISADRIYLECGTERNMPSTTADRMVVGDALEDATDNGPLVDCAGLASVKEHVAHAVAKGARIATWVDGVSPSAAL